MNTSEYVNWKKTGLYLLFTFGISWLTTLVMLLCGIHYGSIVSIVLIALFYMPGPAIATFIVQKFIYKQPFKTYGWTITKKDFKRSLAVPILFVLMIFFIFGVDALFGNTGIISQFGQVDFSQEGFNEKFDALVTSKMQSASIKIPEIPALLFLVLALVQGILAGSTINLPFMFGEEFGWRGLLLRETQRLGFFRSNLLIGLIWGLWHAPIILMGHNYPQHPYLGVLMMCLMTTGLAPIFAYVRLKTKSILGPCMLHGMINATATVFILYISHPGELFSTITGLAGLLASVLVIALICIFDKEFVRNYKTLE